MKFQWSVFIFLNRVFHAFVLTKFPLSLFNTLSSQYLTTAISVSNNCLTFLSQYLFLMDRVLECNQSKQSWHPFACSVAPEDDHLPLMLSCWFSVDLLMISLFVSPLCTDEHEYFNSCTPRQLFGINVSLFLHKILFALRSI